MIRFFTPQPSGLEGQSSAKALGKWGQMTHTTENYGDFGNFSGVTYVMLPFLNLKFVGPWAPAVKIIGDIPDFNVLNVPKTQPRRNPGGVLLSWSGRAEGRLPADGISL